MRDPLGQILPLLSDLERRERLGPEEAAQLRRLVLGAREQHRCALVVAAAAEALCLAIRHLASSGPASAGAGDPPAVAPLLQASHDALKEALDAFKADHGGA